MFNNCIYEFVYEQSSLVRPKDTAASLPSIFHTSDP